MKHFSYEIVDGGVHLTLVEKKRFVKSEKIISLSEWGDASSLVLTRAIGILQSIADEHPERCYELPSKDGYFLSFASIAELPEAAIKDLDLPSALPYQLAIETRNAIGSQEFSIGWSVYSHGRVMRFERKGSLLTAHEETYRLPSAFMKMLELIDNYNESGGANFEDQIAFIAELKSLLPGETDEKLWLENQIATIKLRHAAAFSLKITGSKNSMNFDPVLFGRVTKEASRSGDELVEEDEQLLTPSEVRDFAAAFKNREKVNATYLLGRNNYVYIDRTLRPALEVVKKAGKLTREKRIEFAKAPQKFIKEALLEPIEGKTDLEYELEAEQWDALFIETRQYSDRVIGIGLWEAPDLPWLKREPNEWRADSYCFYIQGKTVFIPASDLEAVTTTLKSAIEKNMDNVIIAGEQIKPDIKFLEFLEGLFPIKPTPELSERSPKDDAESKKSDTFVLLTKENFETIAYHESLSPRSRISCDPPSCLSVETRLKEHQTVGVKWLVENYNCGYPGVLMADDMGLGKTLQALTFLAILVESGKTEREQPILVVAPVGLLKNWEEEHKKHLEYPGLGSFAKLYGNGLKEFKLSAGKDIMGGIATLDTDAFKRYDWLLTTYETLRDYQASFGEIKFSCIVFDELQKAKNPRSLISQSVKAMKKEFAIGLTGTPVENSLADLWTIIDILSPGRLQEDLRTFIGKYPEPDPENPEPGLRKLSELSKSLLERYNGAPAPVLRRLKSELSDTALPDKILTPSEQTTEPMPQLQNGAYIDISNKLSSGQTSMIEALHAFKTISLHPVNPNQSEDFTNEEYIRSSARMAITFDLLDQIHAKGEKALIFLESRAMQPLLASFIKQRYSLPNLPMIINGLVSGEARQIRVNKFQNQDAGFDVMIISPKAGGVGLTLTAANNVIHLERWWNPAVEDQCTDRVYRIGQTKSVRVFTPISRNVLLGDKSFDCVLDRLLDSKRSLAKGLFIPTTIANEEFGRAFGIRAKQPTLEEVDCFERGTDFELYVRTQLRKAGLKANLTPSSYDYGADLIVENRSSGKSAIIQCKHRSSGDKTVSVDAASEVIRAKENYALSEEPIMFIVTNASSITGECEKKCADEGITVIKRDELLNLASIIKARLH